MISKRRSRIALGLGLVSLALSSGRPASSQIISDGTTVVDSSVQNTTDLREFCTSKVLVPGATGECVGFLKGLLGLENGRGPDLPTYDEPLVDLVLCFQALAGLSPDGKVGPATWTALLDGPAEQIDGCSSPEHATGSASVTPTTVRNSTVATSDVGAPSSTTTADDRNSSNEAQDLVDPRADEGLQSDDLTDKRVTWLALVLSAFASFVAGWFAHSSASLVRRRRSPVDSAAIEVVGGQLEHSKSGGEPTPAREGGTLDAQGEAVHEILPLVGAPVSERAVQRARSRLRVERVLVSAEAIPPTLRVRFPARAKALSTMDPVGLILLEDADCAVVAWVLEHDELIVPGQDLTVVR